MNLSIYTRRVFAIRGKLRKLCDIANFRSYSIQLFSTFHKAKASVYKRAPLSFYLHSALPSERLNIYKVIPFLIISII